MCWNVFAGDSKFRFWGGGELKFDSNISLYIIPKVNLRGSLSLKAETGTFGDDKWAQITFEFEDKTKNYFVEPMFHEPNASTVVEYVPIWAGLTTSLPLGILVTVRY